MSTPNARRNWRPVLHDAQGRPTQRGTRFQNTVTGANVSRRQYQRAIGKPLPPKLAKTAVRKGRGPSKIYVGAARAVAHGESGLPPRPVQVVRSDPQFKADWKHLRDIWRREQRGEVVDKSPGGDYAQTLERLGLRPQGATYDVGDTP